jgi:tetratricopeptide (TPR) repeat protein
MPGTTGPPAFGRRLLLCLAAALVLDSHPASADPWYEHYAKAEQALEGQDWKLAVEEINEALKKKGDSGARVRSYGKKVTPYFPYLKLGIAYYHLDQLDAAAQAFETELRLGAIVQSDAATKELERYRDLVQAAQSRAAAAEQQRIQQIVAQSLAEARELEVRGRLDEAMAALDRALAVAPDDADARAAMGRLRDQFAERERELERDRRALSLIEEGNELMSERRYREASSLFRQALSITASPEAQVLLDRAQSALRAELEAGREVADQRAAIAAGIEKARALETAGRLAEALDQLESVLVLAPANQDALSLQNRLLQAREASARASARQNLTDQLLAEAAVKLDAGSEEASLSAANRALALDPGNTTALQYVARAYGLISQRLLGTGARGNIPPAVRFVDLRQEADDGTLVQTVRAPDFRLDGVVIDNTPVTVVFYRSGEKILDATLNVQPLGDYYLTEFNVESSLTPGRSTFRLVATDSEDLVSSSEYSVCR